MLFCFVVLVVGMEVANFRLLFPQSLQRYHTSMLFFVCVRYFRFYVSQGGIDVKFTVTPIWGDPDMYIRNDGQYALLSLLSLSVCAFLVLHRCVAGARIRGITSGRRNTSTRLFLCVSWLFVDRACLSHGPSVFACSCCVDRNRACFAVVVVCLILFRWASFDLQLPLIFCSHLTHAHPRTQQRAGLHHRVLVVRQLLLHHQRARLPARHPLPGLLR